MRFDWDDAKSEEVKAKRGYGFNEIVSLFKSNFLLELNPKYDGQFTAIGFLGLQMITVAVEIREDVAGDYVWIITYWKTTANEEKRYAEKKR